MTWAPHVTVAAVIEKEDRFLVVEERIDGQLVFNQPAGHVEHGETLIDAVIRETREETGWQFHPRTITGVYYFQAPGNETTYLRVCFAGTCSDREPDPVLDVEIVATHWMSRDELLNRRLQLRSPMVLRCIDDYLAGKRYPIDLITNLAWDETG